MKVPGASEAIVPRNKVENYLLDLSHPIGGGKAQFFIHFGFARERWTILADAFRTHVNQNEVASTFRDEDGVTYLVEGPLITPSGRSPKVRTVWLTETGELAPRFITAYPLPE